MNEQKNTRTLFDWAIFLLIYVILVGAIGYAALQVYGPQLGWWVAGSAAIAGLVCLYLFHVEVPRETGYKILLAITVSANAGYLVHNGALAIGTKEFNAAQIEKFKAGMAAAAKAKDKTTARRLSLSARASSELDKLFQGDMATVAAVLAFLELLSALIVFADASKRQPLTVTVPIRKPAEKDEWQDEVVKIVQHNDPKD